MLDAPAAAGIPQNEKPQVSRNYRRQLRQEFHYCNKYGVAAHLERLGDSRPVADYLTSLLGRVNFVLQINPADEQFRGAKVEVKALYRNCLAEE